MYYGNNEERQTGMNSQLEVERDKEERAWGGVAEEVTAHCSVSVTFVVVFGYSRRADGLSYPQPRRWSKWLRTDYRTHRVLISFFPGYTAK